MLSKSHDHGIPTCGTGLLGLNLVRELADRGDRIIAIHRPTSDTRELAKTGAQLVVCGLDDVDALARAMPEDVDVGYHVAGKPPNHDHRDQTQESLLGLFAAAA